MLSTQQAESEGMVQLKCSEAASAESRREQVPLREATQEARSKTAFGPMDSGSVGLFAVSLSAPALLKTKQLYELFEFWLLALPFPFEGIGLLVPLWG